MHRIVKSGVAWSALTIALAAGAPVWAQAPAAPAEMASDNEIIVTAQRREEKLKDVPLTVTAFNAAELERNGTTATRDLAMITPGITIQNTGAQLQATIRGIGTTIVAGGAESPVAVYVDGVYIASQNFAVFDLVNIDSIQVLKGPQGTLFGRNATGGAILVNTKKPSDTLTGKLTASYGRFDEVRVGGYLSGPITNGISASLAAYYRDDNGFTKDALRNTDLSTYQEYNIRGKLLLEPGEATSITLSGDYGRVEDSTGISIRSIGSGPRATSSVGAFIPSDPYKLALTFDPFAHSWGWGGSAEIQHDFDGVVAKSLTAYRNTDHRSFTDQDRVAAAINRVNVTINENVFTQEFTLSSSEPGPFQWLGGLYYFHQKDFNPVLSNGALVTESRLKAEAGAAFAEGTYEVLPQFKVTAGVRYSKEKRENAQRRAAGNPLTTKREATFDSWTPRLSLVYEVDPQSNVYFTYSKGFKSGLYNATAFGLPAIKPETVQAYEGGFKHSSNEITLNVSAYYYDYKNLQLQTRDANGLALTLNATDATIYGVDGDFTYRITPAFRVRIAGAYTNGTYGTFTNAPFFAPAPAPAGGNIQFTGNASGNPLIRTPKVTGNVGVNYDRELANGDKIGAAVTYYYNSGFAWTVDNRSRQSEYSLVNAEVSYTLQNNLKLSVWGRNLTNTRYGQGVSVTAFADAIAYARPISYGVTGTYSF
ncbi:TonB-dependent receptor [Sphingomonas montanisoli]|uniref:TonB-dependent receptor n=1 Tax=Sphingomonas montanisoli TaxID=2606412 RepID=A0A5D9CDG8_9SPHN|nr:TonB-dependent receptor [Sphingomonas montanisoli]TZG29377.1 TonB-dependent receptor [Sphingomonas montanisoli]